MSLRIAKAVAKRLAQEQPYGWRNSKPFHLFICSWDWKDEAPDDELEKLHEEFPYNVQESFGCDATYSVFSSDPLTYEEAEELLAVEGGEPEGSGIRFDFPSKAYALELAAKANAD